jgi:hypothetical protein
LRRQLAGRTAPLLLGVGADEALVEDRAHQIEAPLLEVRGLCTGSRIDTLPIGELPVDLRRVRLPVDVGDQDRPVEDLPGRQDVDSVPVRPKRGHLVRELPDLLVLRMEDVRAVRLVEDAVHVLRADQPAGDVGALQQHAADTLSRQAVRHGTAGEAGSDNEHARWVRG